MRALVQSQLCWDYQRAARGLLAQTAAAATSGLQRSRSLVQEQVERDDFIVTIPCDSTRRRRPFFRRRVSHPSRDNRSISRRARASLQRAGGRAMGQSLERARDHRTTTTVRSSIFRSFVRSFGCYCWPPWVKKQGTWPTSQVLHWTTWDLGQTCRPSHWTWSFFFFLTFFFCHLPPSLPTQPPWDLGHVHPLSFPLLFLSFNINPTHFPSFTSLFGTNLFCLYALFIVLGKNPGLDKFAILTWPSQCFVLEKFCHFFWPKNLEFLKFSSLNLTRFEFFYKDFFFQIFEITKLGEK